LALNEYFLPRFLEIRSTIPIMGNRLVVEAVHPVMITLDYLRLTGQEIEELPLLAGANVVPAPL
jgi:hypothetical protein